MQELPAVKGNSGNGDGSAHSQQQPQAHENGGGDGDGGRNSAGNRWTRQETLALIKIRSDMDAAFRDSNLKSPLWDDVSRKLSELGFHRSAMKCKEKFENVYKYNKRTKEVQTSKPAGKNYRFSDQLQALESNPAVAGAVPPPPLTTVKPPPALMAIPESATVPSVPTTWVVPPLPAMNHKRTFTSLQPNVSGSTSSHISSDEEKPPEKRKKWKDFFGKLMTEVIEKQEKLQMKFLDALEKRDRDRDAWRVKEIERMNQELDLLAGERSIAAAKDTSVIAFLQKITGENPIPVTQTPPVQKPPLQVPVPVLPPPAVVEVDNLLSPAPARWPKAEINALISLRTKLDVSYHENGPKGSLWEEISAAMKKLGFNRNAKRCKEKWENINKYYKKVKDGSKNRSENSKTCPYFDQLDDIYRRKEKGDNNGEAQMTPILAQPERQWPPPAAVQLSSDAICTENNGSNSVVFTVKHETQMAPIIARPEQQWPSLPAPAVVKEKQRLLATADMEDYDGDGYEIVPKKISSMHGCCLERER